MMSLHKVDSILFAIDNWNDFYQELPSKMVDRTGCDAAQYFTNLWMASRSPMS